MIILATGGRYYTTYNVVQKILSKIDNRKSITAVIHGGATGVDSFCNLWAKNNNIKTYIEPADWDKYGKSAGIIRNSKMFDLYGDIIDLVVSFPGNNGTLHCTNLAIKLKYNIIKVIDDQYFEIYNKGVLINGKKSIFAV